MKKILILCLLFVSFLIVKSQSIDTLMTVRPTGYVNDYQKLFTPEQKDTLEKMMSDYEKKTSIEFCLVTYYVDPQSFNPDDISFLGEKWGVGKADENNGFIMFLSYTTIQGGSRYENRTGYGVEALLPDGKLNRLESKIYPNTLYVGKVYEAYKQYIIACQKELGFDDLEILKATESERLEALAEQKRLDKIKREKAQEIFLFWLIRVVIVLLILGVIIYIILLRRRKMKEFLELKFEILKIVGNIEDIKRQVGVLPINYQEYYNNRIVDLTKKLVTQETKSDMMFIYNQLLDYKSTMNSIIHTTYSIKKSKKDIQMYLKDNYPYCEKFIKDELNDMLQIKIPVHLGEYNKKLMNTLFGIESVIDKKLKTFLNKIVKINSIVSDNNSVDTKIDELSKLNSEYIRKKNILSSVKIGNRVFGTINFYEHTVKIKENINKSYDFLLNDNLDSALSYYGQTITIITILKSDFSKVDVLFKDYNSSYNYVNSKKSTVKNLVSDVESKINRSGVSYYRKNKLEDIKRDINKNDKLILVNVILAAKGMKSIISETESLLSSIRSDISYYKRKIEREERQRRESSSGSGSDFGGFGGGSFGGGGSGGSF